MSAGFSDLRHRLVLEAPVEADDGAGGVQRSFAPVATVAAAISPLSARAAVEADRPGQSVTHRITIRNRAGVTAAHRLRKGARIFEIRAAWDPDERGNLLVLDTEEIRP